MKVAIIGTGNMATGLAQVFAASGHTVFIGARDIEKASVLAKSLPQPAEHADIKSAVQASDVVVLAVPYEALGSTVEAAGGLADKIVIDISNPISADYKELVIGHSTSAAEELQKLAPKAKVVKAFSTVFARLLSPEARAGQPLQVFVAGDDGDAKQQVSSLVESAGFQAVDSGPLSNSRYIEPIGEMNIHFGYFLAKGPNVAPAWVTF